MTSRVKSSRRRPRTFSIARSTIRNSCSASPRHARACGEPDDFRRFVDRAHALGLGVILDVVYNHLDPDGAYHRELSPHYYSAPHANEWGEALNFDGPESGPVREFFVADAGYWIEEFHLDGLRLDATQSIHDTSPEHVLVALARRARQAAGGRRILLVAENEPQDVRLLRPPGEGGFDLDALWNDDFHHAARVAVTGRREGYYTDYRGTPQELVSAVKRGFLYQGQRSVWQGKRRGTPTAGVAPHRFVAYLQNHDQVANPGRGERLHRLTTPGRFRAVTALLLLAPQTPLLFQGQEFCASAPWVFFADHHPALARAVGRDGGSSSPSSRASPRPTRSGPSSTPPTPPPSSAAGSTSTSAAGTPRPARFTPTCCACAARPRSSAAWSGSAWTGRSSARKRWRSAPSAPATVWSS
jgi:maltooligosyltrehalose trehalohydrolase